MILVTGTIQYTVIESSSTIFRGVGEQAKMVLSEYW